MKQFSLSKKIPTIPQARWVAYAAAGVASSLANATSAEAEIHYSGHIHLRFTGHKFHSQAKVPLSGGASLQICRGATFTGEYDQIRLIGVRSEIGHIRAGGVRYPDLYHAEKLPVGQNVSSGRFSSSARAALVSVSGFGSFVDRGVGFVGFKFDVGNGTQYGWARIKTIVGGPNNKIAVEDYAWGDPGEPILTGQTGADGASTKTVPVSGSLAALAFGGTGLMAWRKRRSRG